jgi:hypothetical protein
VLAARVEPASPGVLAHRQERDQADETHVAEQQRGHERRTPEQALGDQLPARPEIEQQVQWSGANCPSGMELYSAS